MASVPLAFDDFITDYASRVRTASTPQHEHVAATVTRLATFANSGMAASGHAVRVDEPAAFGGDGSAADPAELLLIAVGASLSVTITVHASLAGVPIDAIAVDLSGTLDAARFFAPVSTPGGGFTDMHLAVAIGSTDTPTRVRAVVDDALLASPMLRSLAVTPAVTLTINGAVA